MPSTHSEREKCNELSKEATVHVPEIFVVHHICSVHVPVHNSKSIEYAVIFQ